MVRSRRRASCSAVPNVYFLQLPPMSIGYCRGDSRVGGIGLSSEVHEINGLAIDDHCRRLQVLGLLRIGLDDPETAHRSTLALHVFLGNFGEFGSHNVIQSNVNVVALQAKKLPIQNMSQRQMKPNVLCP